jgi:hypothetical protein
LTGIVMYFVVDGFIAFGPKKKRKRKEKKRIYGV